MRTVSGCAGQQISTCFMLRIYAFRGVAQLGLARLNGVQEVDGSNPSAPTFFLPLFCTDCSQQPLNTAGSNGNNQHNPEK